MVEHSSVLSYCRFLEEYRGFRVTYLPVDREGLISMADLEEAIEPGTALVSLMWANNETGVLFPIEEIGQLCRSKGVPYHCDAVQAVGKLPMKVKDLPIDYLSITGHKIGAPKGIGALYVQKKAPFIRAWRSSGALPAGWHGECALSHRPWHRCRSCVEKAARLR
jgi:cysteine desulfurase